jgi:hypothetical protein
MARGLAHPARLGHLVSTGLGAGLLQPRGLRPPSSQWFYRPAKPQELPHHRSVRFSGLPAGNAFHPPIHFEQRSLFEALARRRERLQVADTLVRGARVEANDVGRAVIACFAKCARGRLADQSCGCGDVSTRGSSAVGEAVREVLRVMASSLSDSASRPSPRRRSGHPLLSRRNRPPLLP